jgi:mono/diheme cytochrome c family protein
MVALRRLLAAAPLLLALAALGCAARTAGPVPATSVQAVFETACSQCHGLNVVLDKGRTKAGWEEQVRVCAARKMWSVTAAEEEAIAAYLFSVRPAEKDPPRPQPGYERFHSVDADPTRSRP